MKGTQEVEFIISVFVFITTISFVTAMIINNIPLFHNTAVSESLKAKSYQHSELLLLDEGSPKNWDSGELSSTDRIGLSTGGWYNIDKDKLRKLAAFCSTPDGYQTVKAKLGIDIDHNFIIESYYLDNSPVENSRRICQPPVTTNVGQQFQTDRLSVLDLPDMPMAHIKFILIN